MPMPTQSSAAPALAMEAEDIEREIQALSQQQQLIAAANDRTAAIPQSFDDSVNAARGRLARAEGALALADANVRLKIKREQPSEQLARLWYEQETLSAVREVQAAKQALDAAELTRGRRVAARRRREQVERDTPLLLAAENQRHQDAVDKISRDLLLAQVADQD